MAVLSWLHFGDLHVTRDDQFEGLHRFEKLIALANQHLKEGIDFAVLPGDNANNGTEEQYGLIREAAKALDLPLHIIPGDHDFEPGSLDNFHDVLGAERLPKALLLKGYRCLFLDLVSAGGGGPDFRLGLEQTRWLEQQLVEARAEKQRVAVFMHAYPCDLAQDDERIGRMFADHGVAMVDTGHTHYNELLNDGHVIYAATRSTGQIEEGGGNPGFSIGTLDGGAVSWRFISLDATWPVVLITSPADRRLTTGAQAQGPLLRAGFEVRARILGESVVEAHVSIDGRPAQAMKRLVGEACMWSAPLQELSEGARELVVEALAADGRRTRDQITVSTLLPAYRDAMPGIDAHAVGVWAEHGLLGTQLGPNKNGHGW